MPGDRGAESEKSMQDEPLVSILIPTYRRPKELRRVLDSAVAQTYANLDIVISNNDCENAETNALCREFAEKDRRVSYHVQPSNLGAMGNMKFLRNAAKGEYSLSISDDDWLSDNFVDASLRTLRSDPDCVMVHGGYAFHSEGRPVSRHIMDDNAHEDYKYRVLAVARGNLPTHFMAHTRFLREHRWVEQNRYGEDWAVMVKMAFLGHIRSAPEATYHKFRHNSHDNTYYAELFNYSSVPQNEEGHILLTIVSSILHDSFYDDKLKPGERQRLFSFILLECSDKFLGIERIDGLGNCLRYIWRHPLALFRKKTSVALAIRKAPPLSLEETAHI